jgi:hypothetical protein
MISADQSMKQVCRDIFKRLCYRKNWLQPNIINGIVPYSPSERQAMKYVNMVNMWYKPKSIFSNPNADYFTLRLYMQKADDGEIKDEILNKLDELLLELWEWENMDMMQWQQMANSAANIMMSQNAQQAQWTDLITRQNLQSNSINE